MGNEMDPWEWRQEIAKKGNIAYGKFFSNKAGFISKKWFPDFANYRRDGYDFESLYEDGKASNRSKKIMDLFENKNQIVSSEMKKLAGFGKNGEKNFDGTLSKLQMQTYLLMRDFTRKKNKLGVEYGWSIAVYATSEELYGEEYIKSSYQYEPSESKEKLIKHIDEINKNVDVKKVLKLLK